MQPAAISGSVTLLAPANGASSDQNTTFSWQPDFVLTAGQGFELIFWPKGTDPMRDGRGPIGSGTSTSARVDPKAAQNAGLPIGAELFWGVRLVELNPYRPVKLLGVSRTFTFSGGGSSGGSSDNGGSNCVGFACDDR